MGVLFILTFDLQMHLPIPAAEDPFDLSRQRARPGSKRNDSDPSPRQGTHRDYCCPSVIRGELFFGTIKLYNHGHAGANWGLLSCVEKISGVWVHKPARQLR